ncbi:MAG TPA: branched-chain amino acid ABC transporter substrate-binding protein [Noviherbaspirillum sp.]|nr:branched-chain amino acid ABC transporter substrate-binding protein [Noviherbaspirillum sp.]
MLQFTKVAVIGAITAVATTASAQEVVKIGMTGPLTGPQAQAGKDNENGVRMAIDELNAKNPVIGGKPVKFVLLSEDDQADPKTGVSVAQKLVDAGAKAVFGPYNSGVAIPASRVYNDARVVMATVGSNPKITQQGYGYVYRIGASDIELGGKIAAYAIRELKHKKFAVVDDRTAYGQGVAEQFIKIAKENGAEIVGREFTNDKAVDFNSILTSIKNKKPDAVFYGGHYTQGGPLRRQMKQLGLNAALLGGDAICNAELFKLGGDAVNEGVYCVQGGAILESGTAGKAFVNAYQKRYNTKPLTYAVSFYDGMMVVAEAMKKAGSVEPEKYMPALNTISYTGAAGKYEFDAKHDLKQSPVTVYTVKGGEPVALTSY